MGIYHGYLCGSGFLGGCRYAAWEEQDLSLIHIFLEGRGVDIVDATCPFVKKIHRIVSEHSGAGDAVVIIGSPDHPEVEGIKGWGNEHTTVIMDGEGVDIYRLPEGRKLCIVSQTTFNYNKFKELVEKFLKKGYDSSVLNTICNATQERQVEAARIASQVDAMIVIGGRHSSNTQKLYEICLKECKDTFYIQTLGDLDPDSVSSVRSVGIDVYKRQESMHLVAESVVTLPMTGVLLHIMVKPDFLLLEN